MAIAAAAAGEGRGMTDESKSPQPTAGEITELATEMLEWVRQKCGSPHAGGMVCSIVLHALAGVEGAHSYIDSAEAAHTSGAYSLEFPEGMEPVKAEPPPE